MQVTTLLPRHVAAIVVGITALDSLLWFLTGYAGVVVGGALLVALGVVVTPRTRDVGVALLVAVLTSGVLVLLLATYWPRRFG